MSFAYDDASIDCAVLRDRASMMVTNAVESSRNAPLGVFILGWVNLSALQRPRGMIWLAMMLAVVGVTAGLRTAKALFLPPDAPEHRVLRFMTAWAAGVGLAWGASAWLLWEPGQDYRHLLNLAILVAVSGVSVTIMFPVRAVLVSFILGTLLPPTIHLLFLDLPYRLPMMVGLCVLMVVELRYGLLAERQLSESFVNAARNRMLIAALAERSRSLEASRADLDRAQAVGRIGSWTFDPDSGRTALSQQAGRMIGMPIVSGGGFDPWLECTVAEDREDLRRAWLLALHDGRMDHTHRILVGQEIRWLHHRGEFERDTEGRVLRGVGVTQDITDLKFAEERIRTLASRDSLTGLPNRAELLARLETLLQDGKAGGLLVVNLDAFKTINDAEGSGLGDDILRSVGTRLTALQEDGLEAARIGGDEFALVLSLAGEAPDGLSTRLEALAADILARIRHPLRETAPEYHGSACIGIAIFDPSVHRSADLLKHANMALTEAKRRGQGKVQFFDAGMACALAEHLALEADLRQAIDRAQLELHFQPQVDGRGVITGAEALLRWHHPELGLVPPSKFIPIAEESDLILELGDWVMRTACACLERWGRMPPLSHLCLSVNVSAHELAQSSFPARILNTLAGVGAPADRLKIELTESVMVADASGAASRMGILQREGVQFSLDDFGTGYSALSQLKALPLHELKIDRSFVQDITSDASDVALARTVVNLAATLQLKVIAEGVETQAQRKVLRELGCLDCQGYLFGAPMPLAQFEALLLPDRAGVARATPV